MNQNILGLFLSILNAITFSDQHRLQLSQYLPYSPDTKYKSLGEFERLISIMDY